MSRANDDMDPDDSLVGEGGSRMTHGAAGGDAGNAIPDCVGCGFRMRGAGARTMTSMVQSLLMGLVSQKVTDRWRDASK